MTDHYVRLHGARVVHRDGRVLHDHVVMVPDWVTIADLAQLSQRFVVPLRLSERCSRCWMQEHCHSDRCPCVCTDWEALVDVSDMPDGE